MNRCGKFYQVCSILQNSSGFSDQNALTVSINENAPYSYQSPSGSLCFCGLSVSILNDIASKLRLRLLLLPDRHPEYNTSLSGSPADLLDNRANISVSALSMTPFRQSFFDMIPLYYLRTYKIGVHKMHLKGGTAVSILSGLADSFDRNAWIGIILVTLWIVAVLRLTRVLAHGPIKTQKGRSYLWKLFINTDGNTSRFSFGQDNTDKPKNTVISSLPMTICFLWIAIVLTGLTRSLTATLSTSVTTLPFNSPDGLASSDFHIIVEPGSDLFQFNGLEKLQKKVIITDTNHSVAVIHKMLADASRKLKVATPCPFDDSASCSNKGIIPAFGLGLYRWVSLMQVKGNSSLTKPITMKMQSLLQAGITNHLFHIHKIMSYRDQQVAHQAHKHLNGITESFAQTLELFRLEMLFHLASGLKMASVVVFLFELCMYNFKYARLIRLRRN